ncbi:MAG: S-adenosyl-L-methionine-dependent methyltransferase [Piptocephalis tieghemiana]|nr:MAG: S-adenosyl-L-methionine-dependent methyltransferase [Piptocephalis tieghemiana]
MLIPTSRERLLHLVHIAIIGGLYIAPIPHNGAILDIGAGNGQWSKDVSNELPDSRVIGIDIIQVPFSDDQPSNCLFTVCDATKGKSSFPFSDNSFSFIYIRYFSLAIRKNQWRPFLEECNRVLKPGGWVEIHSADYTYRRCGKAGRKVCKYATLLLSRIGIQLTEVRSLEEPLEAVGYQQIHRQVYSHPLGKWAGPVGSVLLGCCHSRLYNLLVPLARMLVPFSQVLELEECIKEMMQEANEHEGFYNMYTYLAQKPEESEENNGIMISF